MNAPDTLRVAALTVRYPRRSLARPDGVSLRLGPGDRLLLLGPSGCGKSSLLRAVAGIIPEVVDAEVTGRIVLAGHDTNEQPIHRIARHTGFLAQDPLDQVVLSRVDDEVAFGLESDRVPPRQIGARVTEALARTGSMCLAERDTATLSGGELQRVALAAVLARNPSLLLLDEPAAMLDPAAAQQIHALLGELRCASLMVEHSLDALDLSTCHLLVLTESGSVLAAGPAREVLLEHAAAIGASGCWLPVGIAAALAVGRAPVPRDLDDPHAALAELAGTIHGCRSSAAGGRTASPGSPVRLFAAEASFRADPARRSPVVVRSATLELRAGVITAVVGPNGSGKTSALLGLAGLLPLCDGTVRRLGRVGMVFQHPEHQFLRRSVFDEVRFGTGLTDAEVRRLLDELHLADVADHDPFRLSGGQQRRLSIAAALAHRPDVLLLDEPTFGQDAANARALGHIIRSVADDGVAVAMVTHDLRLLASTADEVSVVRDGVAVPARPVTEVLRDPAALDSAGMRLPDEVAWWQRHGAEIDLRTFLRSLHHTRVGR